MDEVDDVNEESGSEEEEVAAPAKAKRKGKKWKVRYDVSNVFNGWQSNNITIRKVLLTLFYLYNGL
jgi:hypothetical protein